MQLADPFAAPLGALSVLCPFRAYSSPRLIPEALHTKLREQQEKSGKNLSQYMTWLITQFYEYEQGGKSTMDDKRTVAFQVPAELFDEFKAYLQRHILLHKR